MSSKRQAASPSERLRRIAFIFPGHRIYDRIADGLFRHALARRHWLISTGTNDPDYVRRFRYDALVGRFGDLDTHRQYEALGIPMISALGPVPQCSMPFVELDQERIGRVAAEFFVPLGFRHFGFVGYESPISKGSGQRLIAQVELPMQTRRRTAFVKALGAHVESFSVASPYNPIREGFNRPLVKWLQTLPKPVALLCVADDVARQVVETCHFEGIQVPERVSVLGVNDEQATCNLCRPTLSSVAVPWEQVGEEIALLLDELFDHGVIKTRTVQVPPTGVVVRDSTAPVTGDELVANLLAALRQRSHEPGNLKEILDGFGVTRRQLERRFRLATGHSPLEALQQLRLDHAIELLKDTKLPLEDVSAASGFSDVKHLRRVFRKATGKHPLAWRPQAGQAKSASAREHRLS